MLQPTQKTSGEMLPDSYSALHEHTRSFLEPITIPHQANPKTVAFILSPSHFHLCFQPSPLFAAMPPVSSAFLLGLPATILAVFAPFDDYKLSCWTELEPCNITLLPSALGHSTRESDMHLYIVLLLTNQMN